MPGKAADPPTLMTLIVLSGLSVVSLNMFLPSLANIAREFQAARVEGLRHQGCLRSTTNRAEEQPPVIRIGRGNVHRVNAVRQQRFRILFSRRKIE